MVLHIDSFWQRDKRQLGKDLLSKAAEYLTTPAYAYYPYRTVCRLTRTSLFRKQIMNEIKQSLECIKDANSWKTSTMLYLVINFADDIDDNFRNKNSAYKLTQNKLHLCAFASN